MNPNRPKLVIADDHVLVAQALSRALEDEFELAEIVADGQALVEAVQRIRPDVVLTFDPVGFYGHPDHMAICRFTTSAIALASNPSFISNTGLAPRRGSAR